jgi:hypothetical protein
VDVVLCVRQWKNEPGVRDRVRRITTIARVSGELRAVAQVFLASATISADPASTSQPRDADAHSNLQVSDFIANRINSADDFMTGNERQFGAREFSIDDVQIGSTPQAATRTRTSRVPGTGFVNETGVSGAHGRLSCMACMLPCRVDQQSVLGHGNIIFRFRTRRRRCSSWTIFRGRRNTEMRVKPAYRLHCMDQVSMRRAPVRSAMRTSSDRLLACILVMTFAR